MSEMTTWVELIGNEMEDHGETHDDTISCTLSPADLGVPLDDWSPWPGEPFTLWTKKRVYFPVSYDGASRVRSVSRDPDGNATDHIR